MLKRINIFFFMALFMVPVYGASFFLMPAKEQILGTNILLNQIVKNSAELTLLKAERGEIVIKPGRKTLLLEMLRDPAQLAKDLPRIPEIKIGPNVILTRWRKGKTAEQQFELTKALLKNYISKMRPELVDQKNPRFIGVFEVEEIIYGIAQGFSAFALDLAYEHPVLKSGKWGTVAGSATQYAAFAFETSKEPMLSVSFTSEKNLVNLKDSKKEGPKLIIQSKLFFDFSRGEVNFFFSYTLDDQGSARILQMLPHI